MFDLRFRVGYIFGEAERFTIRLWLFLLVLIRIVLCTGIKLHVEFLFLKMIELEEIYYTFISVHFKKL